MIYSSPNMETFEISSNKARKKQKKGQTYLRTPIVNPLLRSFWGVNQLYTTSGSRFMENHAIFRALSVVWEVFISETTHSKSCLAIILRGQPSFYDQQFARYGFWTILGLLGPNLAQKMSFAHLSAWSPNQS